MSGSQRSLQQTSHVINHDEIKSSKLTSRFHISQVLGKGAFATVYTAQRRTRDQRQTIAIKLINIDKITDRRRKRRFDGRVKNDEECCSLESEIEPTDDTDHLFFPSRLDTKRGLVSGKNGKNCNDTMAVMLKREVDVHRYASQKRHPNIVSFVEEFRYKAFVSGKNTQISAIVMEHCSCGDLHSYLKQRREERKLKAHSDSDDITGFQDKLLCESEARHAMRDILRGLSFLHSIGIAHRDIKPGNIFLAPSQNQPNLKDGGRTSTMKDYDLKLGDFGLAVKMSDDDDWNEAQHTLCGTPSCLAPEVVQSSAHKRQRLEQSQLQKHELNELANMDAKGYGQPADLWSAGCILYVMLVGQYPFSPQRSHRDAAVCDPMNKDQKIRETISRAVAGEWSLPKGIKLSHATRALVSKLLSSDPAKRGFARGLLSMHPFFNHIDVEKSSKMPRTHAALSRSSISLRSNIDNAKKRRTESYNPRQENRTKRKHKSLMQCPPLSKVGVASKSQVHQGPRFVNTIPSLNKLIPVKVKWTEHKSRLDSKGQKIILQFIIFILPRNHGIVLQCERKSDGRGAWMHLVANEKNGMYIYSGKLSRKNAIDAPSNIFQEAFCRCPRKLTQSNHFNSTVSSKAIAATRHVPIHFHQSLGTDIGLTPLRSIAHSSSLSAHSVSAPISVATLPNCRHPRNKTDRHASYKPISSLLKNKNKPFLALFRKVELVVHRMQSIIPTLSIQFVLPSINTTPINTQTISGNPLCQLQIYTPAAENYTNKNACAVLSYEDGIMIRYHIGDRSGDIFDNDVIVGNFTHRRNHFDFNFKALLYPNSPVDDHRRRVEQYSFHAKFANDAIQKYEELLSKRVTDRSFESLRNDDSRPRTIVVEGKSYLDWRFL